MDTQIKTGERFSFDTATVWILALTIPVTALFFIPNAALPFGATKVSLLALGVMLAFIAYVIARLLKGSIILPPLLVLGFVWLVPLAYLLSTFFSGVNPAKAFFGVEFETDTLAFVVLLAMLASLSALAFRRVEHYRKFFVFGMAGVLLVELAQILFIVLAQTPLNIAATDNVVGAFSDLGMVVGLGIVLSLLALRTLSVSKRWKIALLVTIVAGLLLLIIVNSPLVWIIVALFSGALFIAGIMHRRGALHHGDLDGIPTLSSEEGLGSGYTDNQTLAVPLITLLVSLFFLIGGSTIANTLAASVGVNVIDVRPSWQSTFMIGSHTYASSPLFGSGPGTFGEKWLLYRDRALNDTLFWNIDFGAGIGYIPTSFVTTGVLGVLAWLAFLGLFLYSGFRALLFRLPEETFIRFTALASFAGASYVLLLSLFATPGPIVLATGFALLGIFISTLRFGKGKQEWGIVFARSPRVGFVVVFMLTLLLLASVASLYVITERYLSNLAFTEAITALSQGDIARAETATGRSITLAPTERAYRLAATIGIERMRQIANDATLSPSSAQEQFQTALSSSIAAGLEAARLGPNDYQNWTVLGNVYRSVAVLNIDGAYEEAKRAYETAMTLNPSTPVLPYIMAQLELSEGNEETAETQVLAAVNLKRDYIPAILLLSQLEIQLGKANEALQAAEAAAYFAPDDSAVLLQVGLLRSGTGDIPGAIQALTRAIEINPQYANARFFLAAMHALQGDYAEAITQLEVVGGFSEQNAAAVKDDMEALQDGRNPFSLQRLRSLGVPQPPVAEPAPAEVE